MKWLSIVVVVRKGSGQQGEENEKEADSLKGHIFLIRQSEKGNKIDYIIPSKAASSTYPTIRYTVCIHNLCAFQTSSASVGVMFLIHAPIAPLAGREERVVSATSESKQQYTRHIQEALVTQEQRPFLPSTPKSDSIRERADGRRVSWESINDWQQRPGSPFTPTSDEAPSKVNTLQVVLLGVHITAAIGSVHPGRNPPNIVTHAI